MAIFFAAVSSKFVNLKKIDNQVEKIEAIKSNDGWGAPAKYSSDWEHEDEIKTVTIERKVPVPFAVDRPVPVFVDRVRHVPVAVKEYISVPRPYPVHITKPVYIERSFPVHYRSSSYDFPATSHYTHWHHHRDYHSHSH
ncbi:unnamed protein product [Diamesa serratosioi]